MAEQTWLFRQGDLILGPVPTKVLVDKLFTGELSGQTEVQMMGSGLFRKLKDVPELKVHWAKAEAKARVDAQAAEHARQRQKRTLVLVGIAAGLLLVVGVGVAVLGSYLAVHGSSGDDGDNDITFETPVIARARRDADELVDYQMGKRPTTPRPAGNTGTAGATASAPTTGTPKPKMGSADSDGLAVGEVDQDAINAVIAKFKPTLIPCIREVAKPGMPPTKIPIEFSVLETGKVGRVWVDNPDFKNGPLVECLSREMAKWPFKPQPSGATIQLAFNIGKKS
ncbi:MAG: hypothetical protein MUC96_16310 [Myxococcaceae bacterium]|jgi:hypothetical protein|nr:hypothetical protein [Myxococcaceae bacterium]